VTATLDTVFRAKLFSRSEAVSAYEIGDVTAAAVIQLPNNTAKPVCLKSREFWQVGNRASINAHSTQAVWLQFSQNLLSRFPTTHSGTGKSLLLEWVTQSRGSISTATPNLPNSCAAHSP
jgi:hypothetical protein